MTQTAALDSQRGGPCNPAVIRLALFDIDGTLIRSGGAGVRAFAEVFATEFNLPHATEGIVFSGRTDVWLVRQVLRRNGIPETAENFARFFERYPYWLDHFLYKLEGGPCEGVVEFLEGFESVEEPPMLGLLTGNIRLGAELKLRRYNLWEPFDMGAFADDHEDRNCIAAAALKRGAKLLGEDLKGEEILVIGDTPHDVECGKSIGAKVLAVATGGIPLAELEAHRPNWAVKDLRELKAADVLR